MKKIYWRPQSISHTVLFLILLSSLAGYLVVIKFSLRKRQPYYQEKIKASRLAQFAFEAVKEERLKRNIPIDTDADPTESGLIGELASPTTTNTGYLPGKRTSLNPNFAAVALHYLKSLGLKKGDTVAVGISGSFPALNISIYAAIETLELKPIVISSAGSSQWGANITGFLWPDMENFLYKRKIFTNRSTAVSLGGLDDRALGLSPEGKKILETSILDNGYKYLKVKNYFESVEERMTIYNENVGDSPIKAYINIGGGTTSVGAKIGKVKFHPGVNRKAPVGSASFESVMVRFALEGIPVIHFTKVEKIAEQYGFQQQPKTIPLVGEGKIYLTNEPNKLLAAIVLLGILTLIYVLVRLDWGFRLFGVSNNKSSLDHPEQMV